MKLITAIAAVVITRVLHTDSVCVCVKYYITRGSDSSVITIKPAVIINISSIS